MRSFFWSVFSCIRTEYRKIRSRKNSVLGHFHAAVAKHLTMKPFNKNTDILQCSQGYSRNIHREMLVLESLKECNFIKKETPTQMFSCEHWEIFKYNFIYRTRPVVAFPALHIQLFWEHFPKNQRVVLSEGFRNRKCEILWLTFETFFLLAKCIKYFWVYESLL